MNARYLLMMVLGIALAAALSANVLAQAAAKDDKNAKNAAKPKNTTPAAVDRTSSAKARKDIAEAQATIKKAQDSFDDVVRDLRKTFEASAAFKSAQAELNQAQGEFEVAREAVFAQLAKTAEYQAAKGKKAQAEQARDSSQAGAGSPEQVEAATVVMNAGNEVTKQEGAAINADPKASAAKARLAAAGARMSDLSKQFDESVKINPKWVAVRKALDDAKVKLATSQAALESAEKKEAAAQQARDRQLAEAERRRQQQQNRNRRLQRH